MSAVEHLRVTQDRVEAGRKSSTAWQLGMPVRPYVWRRNDPERDAKIAAEKAESAQKSAAAKARFAPGRRTDAHFGRETDGLEATD